MGGRWCGCFASSIVSGVRLRASLLLLATLAACDGAARSSAPEIVLRAVTELQRPSEETDLRPSVPARTEGWFATISMAPPGGGVAVFDSAGVFIRELRAQGRGPGEFERLQGAGFGPGDSLWATEMFRTHLFTPPPALEFVRTMQFTQPFSGVVGRQGLLSRAIFTSPDGMLAPSLRAWDGTVRGRFGPSGKVDDIDAEMGPVALVDASRAWKADGKSYAISLFDSAGTLLRRHERTVDWFPPNVPIRGAYNAERPPARISDLAVGADGNLWVLIRRAHPDWKATVPAGGPMMAPRNANPLPSASSFNNLFEVVLEVLDPASGELLASRILSGAYRGFVDAQHIAEVIEDEDGHILIRIWKLELPD